MRLSEKEKRRLADYHTVFGTPQGQRVISDLCQRHSVFDPCHVPGDSHSSSYNDGRRSVVVDLLRYLQTSPEQLDNLLASPYGDYDPRSHSHSDRSASI